MRPEYKIGQYLEWCTDIPLPDESRESPIFFLKGNEWFLRSVVVREGEYYPWYYKIYLELKNKHTDIESCRIKCKIGFKQEESLSLFKKEFEVSEHYEVWSIRSEDLQQRLPSDYMTGNLMKFVLFFDGIAEPLLELSKKAENTSSELQLLDSQFRLEKLSQDLGKMLHDGVGHDVEIKCDGQTWKVHKNLLSVRSEVLQAMLNSDMAEGRTGVITFQDMDVTTVQQFLSYLYCGDLPEMTTEVAKRFYEIGDKYAVECLKKVCVNYLVKNLTPENSCETLIIAVQHSDSSFKESVIQFIIEKKVFWKDELWQNFRECNPMTALEVYERFCKAECPK